MHTYNIKQRILNTLFFVFVHKTVHSRKQVKAELNGRYIMGPNRKEQNNNTGDDDDL